MQLLSLVQIKIQVFLLLISARVSLSIELYGSMSSRESSFADNKAIRSSLNKLISTSVKGQVFKAEQQSKQATQYRCAKYCTCSVIQVRGKKDESRVNLTQAECDSSKFTDLLTIDRRTQIIHISLPQEEEADPLGKGNEEEAAQVIRPFRMPRLVEFSNLREISIINSKFEVCDSEIFKRGQNLRRFILNYNQLNRITRACLKYLEKLIELNLDHNVLEKLESALFSSLINLKTLSLAYNQLSDLAAHQFLNLTNLASLNLVGNSFKTINLHLLEPMQNSLKVLYLANNQIKSFVFTISQNYIANLQFNTPTIASNSSLFATNKSSIAFLGPVFKNLIKLNVDRNKIERIKLLQLHRFFNVKFLSVRQNYIATIKDKAFNGLKLVELNLAQNQLQTIAKCAFCNSTIKRLVLSHNNISVVPPNVLSDPLWTSPQAPKAQAINGSDLLQTSSDAVLPEPQALLTQTSDLNQATSTQNMLILSQSIFGPLFSQLEYLDLANNEILADQLEILLEPLLKLEYLNLASVGFDRSLPSPIMFKNLRQLKYLNLSHNQLDLITADTLEPLGLLEILDISDNKFSELEESFLVALDEMNSLRVVNLGSNPWYCSQCKVAPLYDWIQRSTIYNVTCILPLLEERNDDISMQDTTPLNAITSESTIIEEQDTLGARSSLAYRPYLPIISQESNLLIGGDKLESVALDFDLIPANTRDDDSRFNFLPDYQPSLTVGVEEDQSIAITIASVTNGQSGKFKASDYCLRCEFPRELRSFHLHELSAGDFKFCAGSAPRFAASEPKIGLTLAIVIIVALFCIIVIVIVMYRKKSNTYYTNETDTDHLDVSGGKRPVLSISSDVEHQFDATDYSSPPMSQSYESYSQDDEEGELDEDEEELELGDEEESDVDLEEEEEIVDVDIDGQASEEEEEDDDDDKVGLKSIAGRLAEAESSRKQQVADYDKNERRFKELSLPGQSSSLSATSEGQSSKHRAVQESKNQIEQSESLSSKKIERKETEDQPKRMQSKEAQVEQLQSSLDKHFDKKEAINSIHKSSSEHRANRLSHTPSSESRSGRRSLPRGPESLVSSMSRRVTSKETTKDLPETSLPSNKTIDLPGKSKPIAKQVSLGSTSTQSSSKRRLVIKSTKTLEHPTISSISANRPSILNVSNLRVDGSATAPTSLRTNQSGSRLGRQRFAISKESSQTMADGTRANLHQPKLVRNLDGGTGSIENDYTNPIRRKRVDRVADALDRTLLEPEIFSPVDSDGTTTAESLSMEALDYVPSEIDYPEGGALEMEIDSPEHEYLDRLQTDREARRGLTNPLASSAHSTHSALTQTSSKDGLVD